MTREEAIERFENVKTNALVQKASGVSEYWQNEIDGTIEAIDMAISALSAIDIVDLTNGNTITKAEYDGEPSDLMSHEEAWKHIESDLISRADAIKAICGIGCEECYTGGCVYYKALQAVPSADRPWEELSVRGRTEFDQVLMTLPSAEAEQRWIPFTRRPMTEEEQKDYPNCTFIFDCVLPDDGEEILVSNGRFVWMDAFCNDIDGCYLDGGDDIDEDMAWMPLPTPYKGGDE